MNHHEKITKNIEACDDKIIEALTERLRYLFPKNIVLIGFMGAGKSSLASYLAEQFNMRTVETDQEIVQREGISIPEIFEQYGEEYFRDRESEVIRDLGFDSQTVISAGGGAVLRDENVENMKANGIIVLLTATPKAILDRVKSSTERPLLNGKMNEDYIAALMEKRRARYEDVADLIIDTTDKTIPEVCAEMILKLPAIVNQTKQTGLF